MAPFRRGRSAQPANASAVANDSSSPNQGFTPEKAQDRSQSAWERRNRRAQKSSPEEPKNRRRPDKQLPEDEDDPYDSDPGESYRDHCMRVKGLNTKRCMAMPRFLQNDPDKEHSFGTVSTSPPSPLASEADDLGNTPASLPRELSRVRYSLRTSCGDGSEKQPEGPSVMERRQLRPNNIHINVSHWSDMGGRNYMEDR
jgi:hypothetical protein